MLAMMKHKRGLIICLSILLFLTGLTFYLNRVLFPVQIKNLIVENATKALGRQVEIGALHFNWVKGFVVDGIKVSQKDDPQSTFIQAKRVSFGVIFIPGLKKHKISVPFINIEEPAVHLIHGAQNSWNFDDLLVAQPKPDDKPLPFEFSLGGIKIENGQVRLDDISQSEPQTLLIDSINCNSSLSFKGIAFDLGLNLPQKQGMIKAKGHYGLLKGDVSADVEMKNIYPQDFLSFIPPIQGFEYRSGVIDAVNVAIGYNPESITLKGDVDLKNVDISAAGHNFQAGVTMHNADIAYANGPLQFKGDFNLNQFKYASTLGTASGNLKASISQFGLNKSSTGAKGNITWDNAQAQWGPDTLFKGGLQVQINNLTMDESTLGFEGQISAPSIDVTLSKDMAAHGNFNIQNLRVRNDRDGLQVVGSLKAQQFKTTSGPTTVTGDLTLSPVTLTRNTKGAIALTTDIKCDNCKATLPGQNVQGSFALNGLNVKSESPTQMSVSSSFKATSMIIDADNIIHATGDLAIANTTFNLNSDDVSIKVADAKWVNGVFTTATKTTITADPQLNISLNTHLKNPQDMSYDGDLTLATFKTNAATIESVSVNTLGTSIRAKGNVTNFTNPVVDVSVETDTFDLSKLQSIIPDTFAQFGLSLSGTTSIKLKFAGSPNDPLSGKIDLDARLNDVAAQSTTFNQKINAVNGTIAATGNTLSWKDFSGTYLEKTFTLTGGLSDFKNPVIKTSLAGEGLAITIDAAKTGDLLTLNDVSGKYMDVAFDVKGTVNTPKDSKPSLDVTANSTFKIENILPLIPAEQRKNIEAIKPTGTVTVHTTLKGPAQEWTAWNLNLTASSPLITIAGYKFNDLNVLINENEGKLKQFTITSLFYDGKINILTTADLTTKEMPFNTAFNLEAADLSKIKEDTPAKTEELRGLVYLTTVVDGNLATPLDVKGKGAFSINDGYLMKKEFNSLFIIPELSHLTFTDANANFVIENQKVTTDNFTLKSSATDLVGKGSVGFNQELNFELNPEFHADTIAESTSARRGTTAIIAAADRYLTIYVEGTVAAPKVRMIKKPQEIIKKTGEIIKDNAVEILKGIFQ